VAGDNKKIKLHSNFDFLSKTRKQSLRFWITVCKKAFSYQQSEDDCSELAKDKIAAKKLWALSLNYLKSYLQSFNNRWHSFYYTILPTR